MQHRSLIRFLFVFLVGAFCSTLGFAQSEAASLESARTAYDEERFEEAINYYEEILAGEKEAFEVYYNLGNAYFKTNDIPRSILNYERARKLNPDDTDLLYNLELANKYTTDKFDDIPDLGVTKFFHALVGIFSSNGWAWFCILFFVFALAGGGLFYLAGQPSKKKLGLGIGVLFLVFTLLCFGMSWKARDLAKSQRDAIVFQPTVTVLSEPREGAEELFVVHEGTKVAVVEEVDDWTRIRLSDGNDGWMLTENVVEI